MHERISKFEILKDKSFSNKGPVMVKNGVAENLSHSDHLNEEKADTKSEKSKKPSLEDIDADFKNDSKESQLQQYLKTKISESKQRNGEKKLKEEQSNEFNELVAFPSDDEASRKMKEEVIKDISLEKSEKEIEDFYKNDEEKIEIINNKESKDTIEAKELTDLPSSFLKISKKLKTPDEINEDEIPNPSIIEEAHNERIEEFLKPNTNLLDVDSNEEENDKNDDVDDLFNSSNEISEQEILLTSRQVNKQIVTQEEDKDEIFGEQSSPFSKKHQEENKSINVEDLKDEVPPEVLRDSLDVPEIPEIEHIPEIDDITDSRCLFNL